jgi:hypothetical protein
MPRDWYRQHSLLLPKRLSPQVNISVERIGLTPFAHAIRYHEVRIANLNIFPYAIHYFLEENTVIITAIHHAAISPDKWLKRL